MAPTYHLRFRVSRTETDLASSFLRGGATLGGAVVRGESDFGVTVSHAQAVGSARPEVFAVGHVVTDTPVEVTVRLPTPTVAPSAAQPPQPQLQALTQDSPGAGDAARAQLSDEMFLFDAGAQRLSISRRARLNVTATRGAPAINGVIVASMSGQGSVPLHNLWSPTPAVVQLPVTYAGWTHHSAVFCISDARIVRMDAGRDGKTTETELTLAGDGAGAGDKGSSVWSTLLQSTNAEADDSKDRFLFTLNPTIDSFLQQVEPQLKLIFSAAWERRQKLVYKDSPYLTKSVARLPVGANGSGYTLASSVNDVLPAFADAGVENLLRICIDFFSNGDDRAQAAVVALGKGPCHHSAKAAAETIGSALSLYQAISKPYRVDGTPVVLPEGTRMVQAESWLMEPSRTVETADDCDGSASSVIAVINACVALIERDPDGAEGALPYMRATGHLFDGFYVYGVSVLGATAGHAAAATDKAPEVAGHAVAIALPKRHVARAMAEGDETQLKGKQVFSNSNGGHQKLRHARDAALFGGGKSQRVAAFVATLRAACAPDSKELEEVDLLYADVQARCAPVGDAGVDVPPLAMEGTAAADARLFTHDPVKRVERHARAMHDKGVSKMISPSVARNCARLDASGVDAKTNTVRHGFYSAFTELSISTRHPLFVDSRLRELNAATPHLIFTNGNAPKNEPVESVGAGATPEQLATEAYSLVPLWTTGTRGANVVSAALDEARMNILQRRALPLQLNARQVQNLVESLSALNTLRCHLAKQGAASDCSFSQPKGCTEQVLSFASLINNPKTVQCYVDTVIAELPSGTRGHVSITACGGLAHFVSREHAMEVELLQAAEGDAECSKPMAGERFPIDEQGLQKLFKTLQAWSAKQQEPKTSTLPEKGPWEAGYVVAIVLEVPPIEAPLIDFDDDGEGDDKETPQ